MVIVIIWSWWFYTVENEIRGRSKACDLIVALIFSSSTCRGQAQEVITEPRLLHTLGCAPSASF